MTKITNYKAKLRERRAAQMGLTLEQFDAHVAEEQRKIDERRLLIYDRDVQWSVIKAKAAKSGRTFTKLA